MNRIVRLENVLYSWYLRRVECTKVLETFTEWEYEYDAEPSTRFDARMPVTMHTRLPDVARRLAGNEASRRRLKCLFSLF